MLVHFQSRLTLSTLGLSRRFAGVQVHSASVLDRLEVLTSYCVAHRQASLKIRFPFSDKFVLLHIVDVDFITLSWRVTASAHRPSVSKMYSEFLLRHIAVRKA